MSTSKRAEAREQWARHRDSREVLFDHRAPVQQSHLFPIWYTGQNALRILVGLDEELGDEDGQQVIASARQAGFLSLDETHTLLDALTAATAARTAADGAADPTTRDLIERGLRIIERTIHEEPLAPPPRPVATERAVAAPLPPLTMPASDATTASGTRTAWLVVGGATLLIAGAAVGAFLMRGDGQARAAEAPAIAACRAAFEASDRPRALQACDVAAQSARMQPDHAIALVYLARLKRSGGDVQGAIADADLAQRLLPANGIALRELGAAFLDANDPGEARRAFVTAVQSDATDGLAMAGLACALHRLGRDAEALRWRDRAQRTAFDACLRAPAGR